MKLYRQGPYTVYDLMQIIRGHVSKDHIHIFVSIPPTDFDIESSAIHKG